jgi:hypothetical protein
MTVPLRLVSSEKSDGVDGVNREATQDGNGIGQRRYLNATRVPNYSWLDANLVRHEVPGPRRWREADGRGR